MFTTIINGAERYITNITYIDIGNPGTPNYALIGTLPHDATDGNGPLFRNSADMTFNVYNAESENLLIYTDSWKIKSNITIEPVVGEEGMLPLSMFFLNSEIGDELYNTGKIIAIYEEATNTNYLDAINIIGGSAVKQVKCYDVTNNHAEHGTDCGKDVFNQKINGFMLKEVTYELVGGGNVFAMEEVYYVLTGLPYAISFDYNGGTYYINLTIDDTAMMKDGTLSDSAVIDLLQFVNIYHTDSNNMFNASPAVLNENGNIDFDVSGVSGVLYDTETQCVKNTSSTWQDDAEYYIYIPAQDGSLNGTYEIVSDKPQEWANDYGDYYIKLNEKGNVSLADVDKLKENRSINGTVEFNWFKDKEVEISRPVQLYFNIVIKPKVLALDGGGNETEYMPYSQLIADAIDEGGTLSADTVNANETLKKELLNLITFKSKTVDVLSTTALGYWNITAKYVSGAVVGVYYEIVYNYSYNGEVYKRTLKMLGNQITSTSGSGDELLYDDEIVLTLNGVGSTSLDEAWFNGQEVLKKGLLDCIRFKGEVPDTDSMSDSELAKWSISTVRYDDYYKIKYNYTSGLESYTKTFKMSRIAPIVT